MEVVDDAGMAVASPGGGARMVGREAVVALGHLHRLAGGPEAEGRARAVARAASVVVAGTAPLAVISQPAGG